MENWPTSTKRSRTTAQIVRKELLATDRNPDTLLNHIKSHDSSSVTATQHAGISPSTETEHIPATARSSATGVSTGFVIHGASSSKTGATQAVTPKDKQGAAEMDKHDDRRKGKQYLTKGEQNAVQYVSDRNTDTAHLRAHQPAGSSNTNNNKCDCDYDDDESMSTTSTSSSLTVSATDSTTEYGFLDILSGRGGLANFHTGNRIFRRFVEYKKPVYDALGVSARSVLVESILLAVKSTGARFLQPIDKKKGVWKEISRKESAMKIVQAIRHYGRTRFSKKQSSVIMNGNVHREPHQNRIKKKAVDLNTDMRNETHWNLTTTPAFKSKNDVGNNQSMDVATVDAATAAPASAALSVYY